LPKGEIKYDSAGSGNPSRGGNAWKLPFALAITVLLASYAVRIQVMWRQAPITAAIVIAGSLPAHSKMGGVESGLRRVSEVIFGCADLIRTARLGSPGGTQTNEI
jgi:hypothetical protein